MIITLKYFSRTVKVIFDDFGPIPPTPVRSRYINKKS